MKHINDLLWLNKLIDCPNKMPKFSRFPEFGKNVCFYSWTCSLPATALLTRQRGNSVLDRHGNFVPLFRFTPYTQNKLPRQRMMNFPFHPTHGLKTHTHTHTPPLQRSRQAVNSRAAHSPIDNDTLPKLRTHGRASARLPNRRFETRPAKNTTSRFSVNSVTGTSFVWIHSAPGPPWQLSFLG